MVTSNNYFAAAGTSPAPAVVEGSFAELDLLFAAQEPEETVEMKKEMEAAKGPEGIKAVLVKFAGVAGAKIGADKFTQFA